MERWIQRHPLHIEVQHLPVMSDPVNSHANNPDFEFQALDLAHNYRAALSREFAPYLKGRVLEVGAGIGQITRQLSQLSGITSLSGVEPDSRFHARFHENNPDIPLIPGFAADIPAPPHWDGIVSINVLEHIEADTEELEQWRRLLAPKSGYLCLFVPARPEIFSPMDSDFGHFRRYTRNELLHKLESAGFSPVRVSYFNFIGYFAWWWTFCVRRQRTFNPAAVRLFDSSIFPWSNAAERTICRPPIGQSLVAIATCKP